MCAKRRELVTQAEAEAILEPSLAKLRKCIEVGWQAWKNLKNTDRDLWVPLSTRTRANFVYDHIAHEAKHQFAPENVTTKHGFLIIWFDEKLCIRFKKFDKRRRTRNIDTNQQRLFEMQVCLPGMEDVSTHLNAGYILNHLQQEISEVAVTCPKGKSLEWWFSIAEAAPESILPHPATKQEPAATVQVRVKKDKSEKVQ
jgi:hypothetical protein